MSYLKQTHLGLLLFLVSCLQQTSTIDVVDGEQVQIINIDKVSKNMIPIDDLIEPNSIEFIPLQTTKESLFGTASKLFLTDSAYLIYDMELKSIFKYKKDGTYERKIGSKGKGPLEYTQMSVILAYNQWSHTLDIFDVSDRLIQYDVATGKALNERKLAFNDFIVDEVYPTGEESKILYNNFRFKMKTPDDTLYRLLYLKKDKVVYKSLPYPFADKAIPVPTTSRFMFYTYQDKVHFFEPFHSIVYTITENGLEVKYKISYEFTKGITDQEKLEDLLNQSTGKNRTTLFEVMETEKALFLGFTEKDQNFEFRRYALYDKENQKCLGNSIYSFFIFELALEVFLRQLSDNLFGAVVPADIIIKYQEAYKEVLDHEGQTPLVKKVMALEIRESDNPILVLMKMK